MSAGTPAAPPPLSSGIGFLGEILVVVTSGQATRRPRRVNLGSEHVLGHLVDHPPQLRDREEPLTAPAHNPEVRAHVLDEELLAAAERGARLLCVSAIRGTGSTDVTAARPETGAAARTRRCARPSSLIWVVTTLRSISIASGNHCLLDTAFPALNPDLRCRFLHGRARFVGHRQYSRPAQEQRLWRR